MLIVYVFGGVDLFVMICDSVGWWLGLGFLELFCRFLLSLRVWLLRTGWSW